MIHFSCSYGSGSGLFGRYSMMNHSCLSNAKCAIGEKKKTGFKLAARAQKHIPKGTEINVRYVGVNVGQPMRHSQMLEVWGFRCGCARCLSPDDLGTFNSAIKCGQCEQGYILPVDKGLKFLCRECGAKTSVVEIRAIIDKGMDMIR